jgi:DNA invertase Pin-like site-specific DNA recombinase
MYENHDKNSRIIDPTQTIDELINQDNYYNKLKKLKEALALYSTEEYSVQQIITKTGISKSTLYRRLSELGDKNECN